MGKHPSIIIAVVTTTAVGLVLVLALAKPPVRPIELKCYFQDAQGLRPGARVRLAGVDVGSVTSVRVRPEMRDHPAEVVMTLETPYELKVPDDAVVSLETVGVMGEVFAQINVQDAHGPPLRAGAVLKSRPSQGPTSQQWLECFSNLMDHKPCDLRGRGPPVNQGPAGARERR